MPPTPVAPDTPLSDRLEAAMDGLQVKTLARRLAGEGADHASIETWRRRIQKYLSGEVSSMQPQTRRRFETALGVASGYFDPPAAPGRRSLERRVAALEAAVGRIEQQLFGAGELPG